MLSISKKEYEIKEKVQLLNEEQEMIYEFEMKLTSDDLKQLREALIGKDTLKMASKINKLKDSELTEEQIDNTLELAEQMNSKSLELIDKLCFREHKEKFIELGSQSKYDEMVEIISDFLLIYFMKKQSNRTNTINSDLAKITQK